MHQEKTNTFLGRLQHGLHKSLQCEIKSVLDLMKEQRKNITQTQKGGGEGGGGYVAEEKREIWKEETWAIIEPKKHRKNKMAWRRLTNLLRCLKVVIKVVAERAQMKERMYIVLGPSPSEYRGVEW